MAVVTTRNLSILEKSKWLVNHNRAKSVLTSPSYDELLYYQPVGDDSFFISEIIPKNLDNNQVAGIFSVLCLEEYDKSRVSIDL